jgi:hypothetical protein
MAPALMPVVLQQTQPKVGPYFYQEWITKRKLKRLITEIVSLLAGKPESFHSDIAASSGGICLIGMHISKRHLHHVGQVL